MNLLHPRSKENGRNFMAKPRTLFDKIWDDHLVDEQPDGTCLIYIDRHLVHEVTSPQAFEGLRVSGRNVRAPEKTLAVVDHNVPTTDRSKGIDDPESATQVEALAENARRFGIEYYDALDRRQGIVHIIGPEQGFTLPGMTIVCGDSHTSTHGAFGALAHGIGTSEVEHVLATQTLIQKKARNMRITVDGTPPAGVGAEGTILSILRRNGTARGTRRSRQAKVGRAVARLYGPRARHAHQGHRRPARVSRLLHQWPHRGSPRRRQGHSRQACPRRRQCYGGAGVGPGEGAGGGR